MSRRNPLRGARRPVRATRGGAARASGTKPKRTRTAPRSRPQAGRARGVRRSRLVLLGSLVLSALIMIAWFPASALYHQRQQLASASAQLRSLQADDRALSAEAQRLSSPAEIERIASQQYQLVQPGQQVYQVLPFNGSGSLTAPYPGDPGLAGPVAPTGASELPAGAPSSTALSHSDRTDHRAPGGVIHRILQTLEFWR